jgi:serine/threonine protein kinase
LLRQVGRGGIGTVYRARDERTGEIVAVKVLPSPQEDPVAARRLAREFQALYPIEHPNIVRVLDAGVEGAIPFLAMEFVEGLNLRSYLALDLEELPWLHGGEVARRARAAPDPSSEVGDVAARTPAGQGPAVDIDAWLEEPDSAELPRPARSRGSAPLPAEPLPTEDREHLNQPSRIARLKDALVQVLDGLGYIHGRGMVHRDLKPTNILVDEDRVARLVDFGLVKIVAAESDGTTLTGRTVGTYRYMSPEQAQGEPLDGRADLYSLGAVVYDLLAGRPPFTHGKPYELFEALLSEEPPPLTLLNPEVDAQLAQIAHRLLRKDPQDRFQTAEEIQTLLLEG